MLLLVDVHVPDAVTEVFLERGHSVILAREEFAEGTPDEVLKQRGHEDKAILVSWDRDFRQIRRAQHGEPERYYNLGRISFVRCPYERGAQRIRQMIELLEFEYEHVQTLPDKRLLAVVTMDRVTIHR